MNNHDFSVEGSAASKMVEEGIVPDGEDLNLFVWPGHDYRDLAVFDDLDRVNQIVTTSPGYVPGPSDIYTSENLLRFSETSHDLADMLLEDNNEVILDFEYGHAVMEDFSPSQGVLSDEEKVENIRKLGGTSNKMLRDGARAVYNLDAMSHGIVNSRKHDSYSVEDYMEGHGALFQDVLEDEYFEDVTWTDQLGGDNYHDDVVFVIADNPIYKLE